MCKSLHAAETHHFMADGRTLLFDVNALAVIDSCELDRVLLDAAAEERPESELLGRAIVAGYDGRGARLRLCVLREQRFLLEPDEAPRRTRVSDEMRADLSAKVLRILTYTGVGSNVRADCRACWTRTLCSGGCAADCDAMRAESEAAIAAYAHFARTGIGRLVALADR
jgi:hypothetical protein